MRNRLRLIALILCSLLLAGCGWSSGETKTNHEETKPDKTAHSTMEGGQAKKSQRPLGSEAPKGASTEVVIDRRAS